MPGTQNNVNGYSRGPSPNRGATVNARDAVSGQETLEAWRKEEGIDVNIQVKILRLSHMRYQHKDFEAATTFLKDFGLHIVKTTEHATYWAGYGDDQYVYVAVKGDENKFLGGAFLVESEAELEKATKIPGAGPVKTLDEAPGGGKKLTIIDPEGFPVHLIWGQSADLKEERRQPDRLVYNFETDKTRVNQFQRFKDGPAAVYKLGHFGLCVTDFETQWRFYTKYFNLVPTDWFAVDEPDGGKRNVALFAHIDRGEDYVDHHQFFISANKTSHVHHCSFEVHDFDTQLLGHKWLLKKGYKQVWGVGRHILGSQIFDYWWDPSEFMIEHYADGDQVNSQTPIGRLPAKSENMAAWGPDPPPVFMD